MSLSLIFKSVVNMSVDLQVFIPMGIWFFSKILSLKNGQFVAL